MSADAWRVCPKCLQKAETKRESSYGKVTEEEYLRICLELDSFENGDTETLREDYECWTDEGGTFRVSYSCSCSVCKLHYEYKFEKDLL
jgi:hypothetical protein